MVKATVGGVGVEVWFTPSFNIKTTDKRMEMLLRTAELEVFDPWRTQVRTVKATMGENEAYLILEEFRVKVPACEIEITQAPELPSSADYGTENSPALQ